MAGPTERSASDEVGSHARPPLDPEVPGAGQVAASTAHSVTAPQLVPDWLVNLAALGWRILAVAGFLLVLGAITATLWTVTASILVAVIVSAVFAPLVLRLRDDGRSRTASAAIVWAAAVVSIGGVLLLLVAAFLPYLGELLSRIDAGLGQLQTSLADLQVPTFVSTIAHDLIGIVRDAVGRDGRSLVAAAGELATIGILATFLVFFFLRDGDKAWLWLFQDASDQKRERITAAGDDALARVGGYLRGTTVLAALMALTDLAFMLLLGVPLAVPLAVLVFLGGYIPYFGGIIATLILLLVTLAALGTGPTVLMLVLIGARNLVLGYGVRPMVYGRTVNIHPAVVLIALPAGFQLAGVIGLFAAVPVTAVVLAVAGAVAAILAPDPPPILPGLVPAWLDRMAQFSWRLLIAVALIALAILVFTAIPLVLIPVVLALVLTATLDPLVQWLMRRGHARSRAAAIAVGGGFLAISGILALTVVSLVEQAGELSDGVSSGVSAANDALGGHLQIPADAAAGGLVGMVKTLVQVGESLAGAAVILLLSTLLTFYFLRDGGDLWSRATSRLRPGALADVDAAASRAFDVLGGYMIGTAAISFVGAASQFLIMVVLGLPLALPVFVLSFFLGFIPYIGGFLSTGIAFLITIAVGSQADIVIMAIWTLVFNIVTGNIVSPIVYGKTVHIHPAIVLVAIPAGAAVAGILGMFIVVPAIGVVAATWRTVLGVIGRDPDDGEPAPAASPEAARGA